MQNLKQLIKEFRESFEYDELPDFEAKCGSDLPKLLDAMEILVDGLGIVGGALPPNALSMKCRQALQLAEEKVRE